MSSIVTTKMKLVNAYTLLSQLIFKNEYAKAVQARNLKKFRAAIEEYNDEAHQNSLQHALEKDGVLLKDAKGNYQYSKDGEKALIEANKKLNKSEVTINPFILPEVKEVLGLSFGVKEMLSIFLNKEDEISDEDFNKQLEGYTEKEEAKS
jgi:hypothetical protein